MFLQLLGSQLLSSVLIFWPPNFVVFVREFWLNLKYGIKCWFIQARTLLIAYVVLLFASPLIMFGAIAVIPFKSLVVENKIRSMMVIFGINILLTAVFYSILLLLLFEVVYCLFVQYYSHKQFNRVRFIRILTF